MIFSDEHLPLREIINRTCRDHYVEPWLIRSHNREQKLVWVRALIAARARNHGYSYPQIGAAMNRDHTSIMNLCGLRLNRPKEDRRKNTDG